MVFSYTEESTIDSFHVSDFGAFDQSYHIEDAVDLSGSKISAIHHNKVFNNYLFVVLSHVMMHEIISVRPCSLFFVCVDV